MKKFARYIIRQFTEIAQKNKKVYMELLFWKTTLNANRLVEGYDTQPENKKVTRNFWSEVEEEELRTLFLEHQTEKYSQGKCSNYYNTTQSNIIKCSHRVKTSYLAIINILNLKKNTKTSEKLKKKEKESKTVKLLLY